MSEIKPEFKKWLTEKVLGECCHEIEWDGEPGYICVKCRKHSMNGVLTNRTFDNWKDYGDVIEGFKMAEKNKVLFKKFLMWQRDFHEMSMLDVFTDKDLFFTTLQEWWEKEWK